LIFPPLLVGETDQGKQLRPGSPLLCDNVMERMVWMAFFLFIILVFGVLFSLFPPLQTIDVQNIVDIFSLLFQTSFFFWNCFNWSLSLPKT